ncbi:hypothetical protein, partial [Vibrio cincinnatiensis]|uniref:hypothetical protein n=1 Tax=Vibrio cincinnatiensis TaxID=675 RepID=UPI001EDD92DB
GKVIDEPVERLTRKVFGKKGLEVPDNLTPYGTTVSDEIAAIGRIGANSRAASAQRITDQKLIDAAISTQGSGKYLGVDTWIGVKTYKPGDQIYALLPNGEYFTSANTIGRFGDNAADIGQYLQVAPGGPLKQYRDNIGLFEVMDEFRAPVGLIKANPDWGSGGGTQIFVQDYLKNTKLIQEMPLQNVDASQYILDNLKKY